MSCCNRKLFSTSAAWSKNCHGIATSFFSTDKSTKCVTVSKISDSELFVFTGILNVSSATIGFLSKSISTIKQKMYSCHFSYSPHQCAQMSNTRCWTCFGLRLVSPFWWVRRFSRMTWKGSAGTPNFRISFWWLRQKMRRWCHSTAWLYLINTSLNRYAWISHPSRTLPMTVLIFHYDKNVRLYLQLKLRLFWFRTCFQNLHVGCLFTVVFQYLA